MGNRAIFVTLITDRGAEHQNGTLSLFLSMVLIITNRYTIYYKNPNCMIWIFVLNMSNNFTVILEKIK